ncbi:MAG: hypothetical protein KA314_04785 [Chloroflexi bacterium]|nr:hypothetical protein [Chloroflexota bacterium]
MSLSKLMTITGFVNVVVMGWLLVAQVVSAEPGNMTVFWVFLGLTLVMGFAYATSQTQVRGKPLASGLRQTLIVETKDAAA